MIWRGQIKAILAIIVVVGLVITFETRSPWPFVVLLVLVPVVSVGFGIVNTLSTAFRGRPLIYDVKIFDQRQGPSNVATPTGNPSGDPPSSPAGFCTNCGRPRSAGARFCANCGDQHA